MSAGHIQRRGKSSWRLKYDVGRDPKTGRRITRYETVHGAKRNAQRKLRELLGAVGKGVVADAGKMTVGHWLKPWIEEARHTVSLKTHERYSEIVDKHLVPALGAIPLSKLARCTSSRTMPTRSRAGALTARAGSLCRRCAIMTGC